MSRQLSYRDMCKFVIRFHQHNHNCSNQNFARFRLWAHKLYVKWVPRVVSLHLVSSPNGFSWGSKICCSRCQICSIIFVRNQMREPHPWSGSITDISDRKLPQGKEYCFHLDNDTTYMCSFGELHLCCEKSPWGTIQDRLTAKYHVSLALTTNLAGH